MDTSVFLSVSKKYRKENRKRPLRILKNLYSDYSTFKRPTAFLILSFPVVRLDLSVVHLLPVFIFSVEHWHPEVGFFSEITAFRSEILDFD